MSRANLLVFGGGDLQVSIICNAKELGYYVIVIDPNGNAIGKSIADKFIKVAGNDFEKTLEIAKEYKVKGIVTAATDKPLLMMARIAEAMNFTFPSYRSIENSINKALLKNVLISNGFACAKGDKFTREDLPVPDSIAYPVIIKPISSSGSRGVVLCETPEDFARSADEAFLESKDEILIEEYLDGDEISVEALVYNKKVRIIQVTDKVITKPPYNVEVGQIQPSIYKEKYLEPMQDYLQKLIEVLELDNCAIHPEFIITKRGLFLVEIGPRLGGDFITSHLVPLSTGINMEKTLIQIATKEEVEIDESKSQAAMVQFFNFPEGQVVKKDVDINYFYAKYPKLVLLESSLRKGEKVKRISNSLNRYGHFILRSNDRFQLENEEKLILSDLYNEITAK